MKKHIFIFISIFLSVALTGCFDSPGDNPATANIPEGYTLFTSEDFEITVPEQWEVIPPVEFNNAVPQNTVVAFRNNIRRPDFTANVAIIKNTLPKEVETLDYAKALHLKMADSLTSYNELLVQQTNISVGTKEIETIFLKANGREAPDKDLKQFTQISAVKGKTAYIATGSMLADDDPALAQKIEEIVRSLKIR